MKNSSGIKIGVTIIFALLLTNLPATPVAVAQGTLLYFTRHAEKQNVLTDSGGCFEQDCIEYEPGKICCTEELSDLGILHRNELADWFEKKGITDRLTHVFASHKQRTAQTVQQIADDAGLEVQRMGPADCLDPGTECNPGCESGKDSIPHILDAIRALPQGSTALAPGRLVRG